MSKQVNKKSVILFNGKEFKVPPGGTLGVLTLGHIGIRAWRAAKKEWEQENKKDEEKA
jgi:hypothetical protein